MERAADSVASDGIGCTSQLENALHSGLMQMGLEMMTALLTSESAREDGYEKSAGERNGGRHAKTITTVFGDVRVEGRTYYHETRREGGKTVRAGHFPWDERMGLRGAYTPAVVADILRLAAIHNYAEAAAEFSKSHGFPISADAIRDVVIACSDTSEAFGRLAAECRGEKRRPLVYIEGDGVGISMFRRHLEGVKGKDGKPAKTREVKLGVVFTGGMKKGEPCRDDDSTTYVATAMRWEEFGRTLRAEYDRRFPDAPLVTIFLTDGGKWLRSVHDNFFPQSIMILDLFHALEHLKDILKELGFKEGTEEFQRQFRSWKRSIKAGGIKSVVKKIEAMAGDARRPAVEKKLQYYRDNFDRMEYRKYSENGWFVGSGVVESGCKCVVRQRLDNSGMHWSVDGAESLLPIRAFYKSGRLDEYANWLVKDLEQVAFRATA